MLISGSGLWKPIPRPKNSPPRLSIPYSLKPLIPFMTTPILPLDLTKQAPHSPRSRTAGFALANRAADKCRSTLAGTQGEYHYNCPLDNQLFTFKGIDGAQFQAAVQGAKTYEDLGVWLQNHGTAKTPAEIKAWSDQVEASSPMKNPERREQFINNCGHLGLNPETNSTFDWLEADDRASFARKAI